MEINIGRSMRIALAQRDKNWTWLADQLGIHKQQITKIRSKKNINTKMIDLIAAKLKLKPSEFIALGEKEE